MYKSVTILVFKHLFFIQIGFCPCKVYFVWHVLGDCEWSCVSHVGKLVRFVYVTKDIVYIIMHGMNGVKVIFS
jgi:hypothetical protein